MRKLSIRYLIIFIVILFTATAVSEAQDRRNTRGKNPEKSLFGKSKNRKVKSKKVREPRSVTKAKRKQEKNEEKIKRDYKNYVEDSRKRAYEIQTPEVKDRMKQNEKDIKEREKAKKKRVSKSTRTGKQKYKK
jgi:hypothetical protein